MWYVLVQCSAGKTVTSKLMFFIAQVSLSAHAVDDGSFGCSAFPACTEPLTMFQNTLQFLTSGSLGGSFPVSLMLSHRVQHGR
jgi:hypothetical protein